MEFDSWIDSALYRMFSDGTDRWEEITVFFRRFKLTGFKRFIVEILDEGISIGLGGAILMLMLALPAFKKPTRTGSTRVIILFYFLIVTARKSVDAGCVRKIQRKSTNSPTIS